MRVIVHPVAIAVAAWFGVCAGAPRAAAQAVSEDDPAPDYGLVHAQNAFYNARYEEAADRALALQVADPQDLAAYELRASALLFQLKNALDSQRDKQKGLKQCSLCAAWVAGFLDGTARGQALARARLAANPRDETARFFLGKLDLNYLWLQLGTLGRKEGWDEYWEARRSLDAVLAANPQHVRARVARAWIDYIVDTKMPRGTRWVLGGGSRKRALVAVREAANTSADVYTRAEAQFSLWDMLVRERALPEAVEIAQRLTRDFPENLELLKFLAAHDAHVDR